MLKMLMRMKFHAHCKYSGQRTWKPHQWYKTSESTYVAEVKLRICLHSKCREISRDLVRHFEWRHRVRERSLDIHIKSKVWYDKCLTVYSALCLLML